jgi:hypothetical protein
VRIAPVPVWKRRGVRELAAFAILMLMYEWLRDLAAPGSAAVPLAHADRIISAERSMRMLIEPDIQRAVEAVPGGSGIASWLYTLGHTPGFVIFFGWLWWRHRDQFSFVRTWFWMTHAVAIVVFWRWPLAPPRLSNLGLNDPTAATLKLGGATSWFEPFRNIYAAMPSLHVGYTVLYAAAITMIGVSGRKYLVWVWPAVMLLIVMATANHYWLDGIGGALAVACGLTLTLLVGRFPWFQMTRPWTNAA